MKRSINANCTTCQYVNVIPHQFLVENSGKRIIVKCKKCKHAFHTNIPEQEQRRTRVLASQLEDYRSKQLLSLAAEFKGKLHIVELNEGTNMIGRLMMDELTGGKFLDPTLSGEHFSIVVEKLPSGSFEYIIKDENSANQLRLNEEIEKIGPEVSFYLKLTDRIKAGNTEFQLLTKFEN